MDASIPDLLRLIVIPVFAWASWHDIRTRRVPNRTWIPLYVLGFALLLWEGYAAAAIGGITAQFFAIQVAVSLGIVAPIAYAFWWLGAFGGADAKALIAIAILFPTYPSYALGSLVIPFSIAALGVFSLTILSNSVLLALVYPLWLTAINAVSGRFTPVMFVGRPVRWDRVDVTTGKLLESTDGFTRQGLDLDALRMYLEWRGETVEAIRSDPEYYRDPRSIPDDPGPVGDGAVQTDGGSDDTDPDDWGAEAFLADVGSAYGTTPATLRSGLDVLTSKDAVWISPGIPFIVPIFIGILVAIVFGDLLVAGMGFVGIV